jgi:hypothetical protein
MLIPKLGHYRLLQDIEMLLGTVYLFGSVITGAVPAIGGIALGSLIQ